MTRYAGIMAAADEIEPHSAEAYYHPGYDLSSDDEQRPEGWYFTSYHNNPNGTPVGPFDSELEAIEASMIPIVDEDAEIEKLVGDLLPPQ